MLDRNTIVKRCDGDRHLQAVVRRMERRGFTARTINTRKAVLGLMAGPFTHKQVHTVVFDRTGVSQQELDQQTADAIRFGLVTPEQAAIIEANTR